MSQCNAFPLRDGAGYSCYTCDTSWLGLKNPPPCQRVTEGKITPVVVEKCPCCQRGDEKFGLVLIHKRWDGEQWVLFDPDARTDETSD